VHDFRLFSRFLSELTEKITGEISLTISAGEDLIFQKIYPVDVLAFDQWNGIRVLPEMAAAFVTPNHPEILTNQISLPADDLVKETARLFGYARLGGNVEQAMKTGIEHAFQKGMIAENNERIVLT